MVERPSRRWFIDDPIEAQKEEHGELGLPIEDFEDDIEEDEDIDDEPLEIPAELSTPQRPWFTDTPTLGDSAEELPTEDEPGPETETEEEIDVILAEWEPIWMQGNDHDLSSTPYTDVRDLRAAMNLHLLSRHTIFTPAASNTVPASELRLLARLNRPDSPTARRRTDDY